MNVQHVSHVILQWNIMINPGISGSNCVGEKVRHLTTTLPQQVAADILNFLTAVELSHWKSVLQQQLRPARIDEGKERKH